MIQNELIKLLQVSLVISLENKGQGSFYTRQAGNPSAVLTSHIKSSHLVQLMRTSSLCWRNRFSWIPFAEALSDEAEDADGVYGHMVIETCRPV